MKLFTSLENSLASAAKATSRALKNSKGWGEKADSLIASSLEKAKDAAETATLKAEETADTLKTKFTEFRDKVEEETPEYCCGEGSCPDCVNSEGCCDRAEDPCCAADRCPEAHTTEEDWVPEGETWETPTTCVDIRVTGEEDAPTVADESLPEGETDFKAEANEVTDEPVIVVEETEMSLIAEGVLPEPEEDETQVEAVIRVLPETRPHTLAQLRQKAKTEGHKGYSKLNKAELEELLGY